MKYIPLRNVNRMFPFEFYKELNSEFKEWIPQNPAFTLELTTILKNLKSFDQKDVYYKTKKASKDLLKTLEQQNIIEFDAFPVLLLDSYVQASNVNPNTGDLNKNTKSAYLFVQYFDSSSQPIFAKDVKLESIRKIPEILYDDPNLLIGLFIQGESENDGYELAIIKGPDNILSKFKGDPDNESN